MRVRIALHTGEVIPKAANRFGKTGMLAARIAAQARGGQILVSAKVRELTDRAGDLRFGPPVPSGSKDRRVRARSTRPAGQETSRSPRPATCSAGKESTGRSPGADGIAG
jgi:class 3 adenylate cyclase